MSIVDFLVALWYYPMGWWHRVLHVLGLISEYRDVYCKDTDELNVYQCERCSVCNFPRDEHILTTKAIMAMPLAFEQEDLSLTKETRS